MTVAPWLRSLLFAAALTAVAGAADITTVRLERADVVPVDGQDWHPILDRELLRQSLLLAAREEFGLRTRDAELGEAADGAGDAAGETLTLTPRILFSRPTIQLDLTRRGSDTPVVVPSPNLDAFLQDVPTAMAVAEAMSREQFVKFFDQSGLAAQPALVDPQGEVDVEADQSLAELDPLMQIAGVRLIHRQLREQGESPARLAALARGYANLWQLTAFVWGGSPKLFAARALLYGQRAVVKFPRSPEALDGRAYALALVGLPGRAIADLNAAKAMRKRNNESERNALVRHLAGLKAAELSAAAGKGGPLQPLAQFFAFLAIEHSGATQSTIDVARRALDANPANLRLLMSIDHLGGPGTAAPAGAEASEALAVRVASIDSVPGIPAEVATLVQRLRGPVSVPGGRSKVVAALHAAGQTDTGEPSWHSVARQIEDLSFMCVMQEAYDRNLRQGVGAAAVIDASTHLVAGHRYRSFLDVLRYRRDDSDSRYNDALAKVTIDDPTYAMEWVRRYWQESAIKTRTQAKWDDLGNNGDATAFDYAIRAKAYDMGRLLVGQRELEWIVDVLRRTAPDSPILHACETYLDWSKAEPRAEQWLAESGDYPALTLALARGYERAGRFEKAIEMYGRYLAVSNDFAVYRPLAECHLKLGREDKWLSTLVASVAVPPFGFEHANVRVKIANYLVTHGRAAEALPYARDAAAIGTPSGMECLSDVALALGDFRLSEQAIRDYAKAYDAPDAWPLWCVRTGRGNWPTAAKQLDAYETELSQRTDRESVTSRLIVLLALGRVREAEDLAADVMARTADPYAGLFAVTLAMARGDTAARDRMIGFFDDATRTFVMPDGTSRQALTDTGRYFGQCLRDNRAVDGSEINKLASRDFRDEPNVFYFAARYSLVRGDTALARDFFKRSAGSTALKSVRSFAAAELRGLNAKPATRPATMP